MNKRILTIVALLLVLLPTYARKTFNFNSGWTIDYSTVESMKQLGKRTVTLPHAWNEDDAYRMPIARMTTGVVWYRKTFRLPKSMKGKHVFIEFEGARQTAQVFLNGKELGWCSNGVMAFGFDLTNGLKDGDNLIEVKTDNDWKARENGTGSSYEWSDRNFNANYGGLPKNVKLHVMDDVYQTLPLWTNLGTTGTYIYGKDYDIKGHTATIHAESQVKNASAKDATEALTVVITDNDGNEVARFNGKQVKIPAGQTVTLSAEQRVSGLHFWSWGYGYLYNVKTIVGTDEVTTTTGFRKAEFKDGIVWLNDRAIMMHGYAQRSTNEWPGVGSAVPAWLSDYSNNLFVKSGGNLVRWMHICPSKQDIESCDRVGLIEAMPAGDAEKDAKGRWWQQRAELMRDAIIYNRNNPSILFYECGNNGISEEHMAEMKSIRDEYDPDGGRAIGSRNMLDSKIAEYGGEMLYVNKSDTKPMWMMEYCRDEGMRWYWNSWSYPYHEEGTGPVYRGSVSRSWNHNSDELAAEFVRRWYEYWAERPGSGTKVNSGGTKIIFSDTQTHGRSQDYRVSGVVDPMRIPKDGYFAHQVMWDGWVDDLKPHTYICGHWNYKKDFVVPTIYVVSTSENVVLKQGNNTIKPDSHESRFLNVFKNVKYTDGTLTAIGYDKNGKEESRYTLETAGEPAKLRLTPIMNPTGWKADGADVALVDVEVLDSKGRRCPLANNLVKFTVNGPAEWRGGVGYGKNNCVLQDTLRVQCGITRVMLRSLTRAGTITLNAVAESLPSAKATMTTNAVTVENGMSSQFPADGLKGILERGETPSTPSFKQWRTEIAIAKAEAPTGNAALSFDTFENTAYESEGDLSNAWIKFTLKEKTKIDDICVKMKGFRGTSYPLRVYADGKLVWEGWTPKALSFVHLQLKNAPAAKEYVIKQIGKSTTKDAFGDVKELDSRNDEKALTGKGASLKILEIEFLKNL